MKIRHLIAAALLLGASTAHAAPVFSTSTVASWTIEGGDADWLPIFVPVLSVPSASAPAAGTFTLQRNGRNGVVVYLTSLANVLGIGVFIDARGNTHRGFIRTKPTAVPAPANPAPVLVAEQEPAPLPVFEPVASSGDVLAPSTGSVADEVAAGATEALIGQVPAAVPPLAAPVASAVPEPATGMLLLAGLAGSALFARRRQRSVLSPKH